MLYLLGGAYCFYYLGCNMMIPDKSLVSVVIPCYNVAEYLPRAINSVLAQTHAPVEVICVNNNSTDDTPIVISDYVAKFPQLVSMLHEPKQGAPIARNCGLKAATGEWVQFLDADDELSPTKIECQLALTASDVEWIIGGRVVVNLNGERRDFTPWPDPVKGLAHGMFGGQTSADLWRRVALNKIGGWEETLPDTQDTELGFRAILRAVSFKIDEQCHTISYDRARGQITQVDPAGTIERHIQLRLKVFDQLKETEPLYWQNHQEFLMMCVFRYVKLLATYDLDRADDWYRKLFHHKYPLTAIAELKIKAWHIPVLRILGFRNFERLKALFLALLK